MIGLDTNVLLRLFVEDDDPAQTERARSLVGRAGTEGPFLVNAVVLAEFAYGGKRVPSFPSWFINDLKPSRAAWLLKERILPPIYWQAMLKGREPMAKPEFVG